MVSTCIRLHFLNNNTYGRSRSEAAAMQIHSSEKATWAFFLDFQLWFSDKSNGFRHAQLPEQEQPGSTTSFAVAATASDLSP